MSMTNIHSAETKYKQCCDYFYTKYNRVFIDVLRDIGDPEGVERLLSSRDSDAVVSTSLMGMVSRDDPSKWGATFMACVSALRAFRREKRELSAEDWEPINTPGEAVETIDDKLEYLQSHSRAVGFELSRINRIIEEVTDLFMSEKSVTMEVTLLSDLRDLRFELEKRRASHERDITRLFIARAREREKNSVEDD